MYPFFIPPITNFTHLCLLLVGTTMKLLSSFRNKREDAHMERVKSIVALLGGTREQKRDEKKLRAVLNNNQKVQCLA
jgi:hypothetical protein